MGDEDHRLALFAAAPELLQQRCSSRRILASSAPKGSSNSRISASMARAGRWPPAAAFRRRAGRGTYPPHRPSRPWSDTPSPAPRPLPWATPAAPAGCQTVRFSLRSSMETGRNSERRLLDPDPARPSGGRPKGRSRGWVLQAGGASRRRVVLPQPEWPRMQINSPSSMVIFRSSSARKHCPCWP